jgi:hypothetical protein
LIDCLQVSLGTGELTLGLLQKVKLGTNIMVAGLAVQVASLLIFIALCGDLARMIHGHKQKLNPRHADLHDSRKFKTFLWSLALATLCIFVRSVFRVAELSEGFKGHLANNQISFMVLDGTMVIIACLALTIFHPGRGFGRVWDEANFTFLLRKAKGGDVEMESSGVEGSFGSGREKGARVQEEGL